MRKLYQATEVSSRCTTTWHNPTDRVLKFPLYGTNGERRDIDLAPGQEIDLDSGYDANITGISPHLKRGEAPAGFTPEPVKEAKVDAPPAKRAARDQALVIPKSAVVAS
jgi:hypothetical protein